MVEASQQPNGWNCYVTHRIAVSHAIIDSRLAPSPPALKMRSPMCTRFSPRSLHQVITIIENALQRLEDRLAQWVRMAPAQLGAFRAHKFDASSEIIDASEPLRHTR